MSFFRPLWLKELLRESPLARAATLTLFAGVWVVSIQLSVPIDRATSVPGLLQAQGDQAEQIARNWVPNDLRVVVVIALLSRLFFYLVYARFLWLTADAVAGALRSDDNPVSLISMVSTEQPSSARMERARRMLSLDVLLKWAGIALLAAASATTVLALLAVWGLPSGAWLASLDLVRHVLDIAVAMLLFGLLAVWLFDIGHPDRFAESTTAERSVHLRLKGRAVLRHEIADIIWRSRYSIVCIGLFAAMTLVMDQGKDVLVGLSQASEQGEHGPIAIGVTIASVWLFAHASYLWPRVLARTQRPSTAQVRGPTPESQIVAKWWARLLGAAPMLILTLLSGAAAQSAFSGGVEDSGGWLILLCSAVSLAIGLFFFGARAVFARISKRDQDGYYEVLDTKEARYEALRGPYRFFGIPNATTNLIVVSLVFIVVIRLYALNVPGIPLALAAIAAGLTLWACILGQLSALSLRQETPWVSVLVAASGLLGAFGWTDNHRVPIFVSENVGLGRTGMAVAAGCVGACLVGYALGLVWLARATGPARRIKYVVMFLAAAALTGSVLAVASHFDGATEQVRDTSVASSKRVDEAILQWLRGLCDLEAGCPSGKLATTARADRVPADAYLVFAEGGGISAAYWTARALAGLTTKPMPAPTGSAALAPGHFAERTFAVSAASGGAIGAAAWRLCLSRSASGAGSETVNANDLNDCVDRLGRTDLLTPLVSAWLFEDVVARLVPTGSCATPGCGFMSRGLWFERSLEAAFAQDEARDSLSMRSPLNGAVGHVDPASGFAPHLFLNSTVVESGARAIASDLRIDSAQFPNAIDQQDELGAKLKLSTAAHNAARFPFVNAIGAVRHVVRPDSPDCPYQTRRAAPTRPVSTSASGAQTNFDCLHLADGAYFDNSGAQTTQDIVRAIDRVLPVEVEDPPASNDKAMLAWMAKHLRLTGIFLNHSKTSQEEQAACAAASREQPLLYDPTRPTCQGPLTFYSDLFGPVVAAVNAGGGGASSRLAESHLQSVIAEFNEQRQRPSGTDQGRTVRNAGSARPPVIPIELPLGKVPYPFGWYLSPSASQQLKCQAEATVDRSVLPYSPSGAGSRVMGSARPCPRSSL